MPKRTPKLGRPPKCKDGLLKPTTIRLTPVQMKRILALHNARGPHVDRADIIREIIDKGLGPA